MIIGNIISTAEIKEENFKVYDKLNCADDRLPTIIIGWEQTKELFGEKVSILHKKINDNLFWTFSTKERKVDYEKDIEDFKDRCFNNFGNDIPYVYVDPIHSELKIIKKILRKIYTLNDPITYISHTNMVYIYGENVIFGIDLNVTEFIGVKTDKIIKRIKLLPNNILLGNEIFNKCKVLIKKLNNREKLLPYIIRYGTRN